MRSQRRGDVVEFRRTPGERRNAGGNNDAVGQNRLAVFKYQPESAGAGFDSDNLSPVEIRNGVLLMPQSVIHKAVERHSARKVVTAFLTAYIQIQRLFRFGNIASI